MDLSATDILIGASALGSAAAIAMLHGTFLPRSNMWGRNISSGPRDGAPRVALTFDDGPTLGYTDRILEILNAAKVRGTFFVIGSNVRQHPDLVRAMCASGHIVGNHTFEHAHLGMFGFGSYWHRELRETNEAIQQTTGYRPAMFRPPMGFKTFFIASAAKQQGMHLITWSRRALDGLQTTPERILNRLVPHTQAGDIILLHDGIEPAAKSRPDATVAAVGPLISRLHDRGFQIVGLDELLGIPAYQ